MQSNHNFSCECLLENSIRISKQVSDEEIHTLRTIVIHHSCHKVRSREKVLRKSYEIQNRLNSTIRQNLCEISMNKFNFCDALGSKRATVQNNKLLTLPYPTLPYGGEENDQIQFPGKNTLVTIT